MVALRYAAAALALSLGAPVRADPVDRWAAPVREASRRFAIPESWIWRVMQAESGGRTQWGGRPIESSAGAMGLMQLMPRTWGELRVAYNLGTDPHDPRDNILAGTAYLRAMYDRFGYPGMFAAYNAGPARYAEHLATGRRLPGETIAYVAKTAPMRGTVRLHDARPGLPAPAGLFAVRVGKVNAGWPHGSDNSNAIFVALVHQGTQPPQGRR